MEKQKRIIEYSDEIFLIKIEHNPALFDKVRKIEGAVYDKDNQRWHIPVDKAVSKDFALLALTNGFMLTEAASKALQNTPQQKSSGLKCDYIDIEDAMTSPPPKIDFVLPGLIAGTVGSIIAPGATGKGYLSLALGYSIAAGIPLCGGVFDSPAQGAVTLFCGEDKTIELQRRIRAFGDWLQTNHTSEEFKSIISSCKKNLFISSEHGNNIQLMDDRGTVNHAVKDSLIQAAENSRLLVIDTFRRFYGGDENSSGQVNQFLCALEEIAENTGSTILFTHHANKAATLNGQTAEAGAARGSSVLTDNIRWQLNLATMSETEAISYEINPDRRKSYVQVALPKANYLSNCRDGKTWVERKAGGILEHVTLIQKKKEPTKSNRPQKGQLRTV